MPAPIDAVSAGGPANEALPSGDELQALEQVARRQGSDLESEDLTGLWRLERSGPGDSGSPRPWPGWRCGPWGQACGSKRNRIPARIPRRSRTPGLKLTNAVQLGPLVLRFQGPGWLEGRRPLLRFQFDQLEIRAGQRLLLQRSLPAPDPRRGAFFALIASGAEGSWLAARGRSGGLAVWRRDG